MYKIDKQWPETCWQDGREGHELTLSFKNNEITTYCSTTIDQKKCWNLPKKIRYIQRQRISHNKMVGRAQP